MFSTHLSDFYASSIEGTIQKVGLLVFIHAVTSKKFFGSYQHFVEKYSVSCVQMKKNDITVLQLDPGTKITITYVIRWHCILFNI